MKTEPSHLAIPNQCSAPSLKLRWSILLFAGATLLAHAGDAGAAPAPEQKGAQRLVELNRVSNPAHQLPSERDIPELSPLADAWAALPKETYFVPTVRAGKSVRVAVQEVGQGRTAILCVHGLFSDSSNWRYLAGALGTDQQLWLVDLPGCGGSERIKAARNDLDAFSPEALADRALQVLEARLAAHAEVNRVLIAGHSLGGMIVLRMFANDDLHQRYQHLLAKVEGLVLLAPADVSGAKATEDWLAFLALNSCKVEIGKALGLVQSSMIKSLRAGFCDPAFASRELLAQGQGLLENPEHRIANQCMMRAALPWREFAKRSDFDVSEALEAGYQHVQLPCLMVWGQRDETLPAAMGYKLKDQLPNAHLVLLPRSKHLLPLERPAACAELIRNFEHQLAAAQLPLAHSVRQQPCGNATGGSGTALLADLAR